MFVIVVPDRGCFRFAFRGGVVWFGYVVAV